MDNNNIKTAIALGVFDGVHIGHVEVIKSALRQEQHGLSPAVFTFRCSAAGAKNIIPHQMKFDMLRKAGIKTINSSDFADVKDMSAEEFVKEVLVERMNCGHISCGWNFRFAKNASADTDDLKRVCAVYGIDVVVVPPVCIGYNEDIPVSSTRIRQAITEGQIELANMMLGYDLTYKLEVVEGAKLGRKLGAPTINQIIPDGCVMPKYGVYKSRAVIDVISYVAVTNIGVKPTVASDTPVMETHIPGFNMEMYGQSVKVSLLKYIREEKKFGSLDELKEQIHADVVTACRGG